METETQLQRLVKENEKKATEIAELTGKFNKVDTENRLLVFRMDQMEKAIRSTSK